MSEVEGTIEEGGEFVPRSYGWWKLGVAMIGLGTLPLGTVIKFHVVNPTRDILSKAAPAAHSRAKTKGWKIKTSTDYDKGILAMWRIE